MTALQPQNVTANTGNSHMTLTSGAKYFIGYSALSVALLAWSIASSLEVSHNYFSFIVEITDGFKLGILINFIFFSFIITARALQLLLFGELRIIEIEHIVESVPMFTVNLLFNLVTNDHNLLNCVLLGFIVMSKLLHVILTDRLDFVHMKVVNTLAEERYTSSDVLRRYISSLYTWLIAFFIVADFVFAKFLVYDAFKGINSVTCLLFGFQFALLGVEALTFFSKLLLNIYELAVYNDANEDDDEFDVDADDTISEVDLGLRVWEKKGYYNKAIDIFSSSLKAVSYLAFIYLLTFHSGLSLPISMLQGTYSSIKKTYVDITLLFAFIESARRLDSQLATATTEDLSATDNLCIICREDMYSVEAYRETRGRPLPARKYPKKLDCGHILHMGCLKDWLERSENCPLCRRKVFAGNPTSNTDTNATNAQPEQPIPQHPIVHPEEVLDRRLEEYTELARQQNLAREQAASSSNRQEGQASGIQEAGDNSDQLQTIKLPDNAIIPPNWTILPIHRMSEMQYGVDFSTRHRGTLSIRPSVGGRELDILRPRRSESENE